MSADDKLREWIDALQQRRSFTVELELQPGEEGWWDPTRSVWIELRWPGLTRAGGSPWLYVDGPIEVSAATSPGEEESSGVRSMTVLVRTAIPRDWRSSSDLTIPLALDARQARDSVRRGQRHPTAIQPPGFVDTFAQLGNAYQARTVSTPISAFRPRFRTLPGFVEALLHMPVVVVTEVVAQPELDRERDRTRDAVAAREVDREAPDERYRNSIIRELGRGHIVLQKLETQAKPDFRARATLRAEVSEAWSLGGPDPLGHPRIPRHQASAELQPKRPMIDWEVDTARTLRSRAPGDLRTSHGWDVVFGRSALAAEARLRAKPEFYGGHQPNSQVGGWLKLFHNDDKLTAVRCSTSWIPWVLVFAQSADIDLGRIIDTLNGAGPRERAGLTEMQEAATKSWSDGHLYTTGTQVWATHDDNLIDRLFNSMSGHAPHVVVDKKTGKGQFVWTFTWHGNDAKQPHYDQDGLHSLLRDRRDLAAARLPDVEVWTKPVDVQTTNGRTRTTSLLAIEEIRLRWPGKPWAHITPPAKTTLPDLDPSEPSHVWTRWGMAKWFVRQAILISGQLDWHLARCHLYVEQTCAVLAGTLGGLPGGKGQRQDHPLLAALWPFLRSAHEINAFGDLTLLSDRSVLAKGSPLSHAAVVARMRHQRVAWHWKDFKPRDPVSPQDAFGRWGQLAWEACKAWARKALGNKSLADLGKRKKLGKLVRSELQAAHEQHATSETSAPWWGQAGDAPAGAATPTPPKTVKTEWPETKDEWIQFAAHAVWTATFLHSWVGGAQFGAMGNVFVASLGHRWSAMPDRSGGADKSWEDHGPLEEQAGFALALAELIGRHRWGRMADREWEMEEHSEPAAYEALLDELEGKWRRLKKAERDRLGKYLTADEIRGRVNI